MRDSSPDYDVFIAHASEDKDAIARPLYRALLERGISVWFDEATLKLGDNLRQRIDEGLARCRYGVVILSRLFFIKQWPQRELDGLVARETTTGEIAILPIWHGVDAAIVAQYSAPLANRLAARSEDGIHHVVEKILLVLNTRQPREAHVAGDARRVPPASPRSKARPKRRTSRKPLESQTARSDLDLRKLSMLDAQWTVNLGYGFAFYVVVAAGGEPMPPGDYLRLAQMVAEPAQKLGLDIAVPDQVSYSQEQALVLGELLTKQLGVRSTRLASLFEFVWLVLLLLFAKEDGHSPSAEERRFMEAKLTRHARNAELLHDHSKKLIRKLAWENLDADQKKRERDHFVDWVHSNVARWSKDS